MEPILVFHVEHKPIMIQFFMLQETPYPLWEATMILANGDTMTTIVSEN